MMDRNQKLRVRIRVRVGLRGRAFNEITRLGTLYEQLKVRLRVRNRDCVRYSVTLRV